MLHCGTRGARQVPSCRAVGIGQDVCLLAAPDDSWLQGHMVQCAVPLSCPLPCGCCASVATCHLSLPIPIWPSGAGWSVPGNLSLAAQGRSCTAALCHVCQWFVFAVQRVVVALFPSAPAPFPSLCTCHSPQSTLLAWGSSAHASCSLRVPSPAPSRVLSCARHSAPPYASPQLRSVSCECLSWVAVARLNGEYMTPGRLLRVAAPSFDCVVYWACSGPSVVHTVSKCRDVPVL